MLPSTAACFSVDDQGRLGSGAFSEVFPCVYHSPTGDRPAALKVDTSRIRGGARRRSMLIYEAAILKDLQQQGVTDGVPTVRWVGQVTYQDEKRPGMIMDRLHTNLTTWMENLRNHKHALSLSDASAIVCNVLKIIAHVHRAGYVHRDIKPDNLMLGIPPDTQIYLVDFGLGKRYLTRSGEHIPYSDQKPSEVGTPRFCATYTHERVETSRRDDLQSIIFLLLALYFDKLPWQSTKKRVIGHRRVLEMKREFLLGESTSKTYTTWLGQFPDGFFDLTRYVLQLGFEEAPDYAYLISGLESCFRDTPSTPVTQSPSTRGSTSSTARSAT